MASGAATRIVRALLLVLLIAVCTAFPLAASPFALRVAQTMLFGAALATAWNIPGGFAGYWSFGNAAFLGLGAFAAALLQEHVDIGDPALRFSAGLAAGGGAAALLALIIGAPILRLRGAYFAIAMLGVSLVLAELSSSVDLFEGALGITVAPVTDMVGPDLAPELFFFYVFLALAIAAIAIAALVRRARLGYGLIAIREDEDTARMLGVPTERYKLCALVLSALITGLTGAAHAFSLGYITTASVFRADLSFDMIVHSLLGGIGTLSGPVLGTAIMTVLTQVVLGDLLQVHMMLTGAVIIALVFLLPGGLMGLWPPKGSGTDAATDAGDANAGDIAPAPLAAAPDGTSAPILRLAGLTKQFRGLKAIDGVSIDIEPHRITSIIGPNGAGKSTLFNMVTGYLAPTSGEIWYEGERADGVATPHLSRRGIARAFQIARPFAGLSVYENVLVGALFGRAGRRDAHRETRAALALTGLAGLAGETASSLPVGHLRRLEIARAVATRPNLLLADEPCAGLNPAETREMMAILQALRARGTTVVLVEHDMQAVMAISDRIFVVAAGRLIAAGAPRDVVRDPAVIVSYLGEPSDAGALGPRASRPLFTDVKRAAGAREDTNGKETAGGTPAVPGMPSPAIPVLEATGLAFAYDGAIAVSDVSLRVDPGQAVALLGANGAGKSTTARMIAGALKPQAGRILFAGEDVTALPSSRVVEAGITLVPEGRLVFPRHTVMENLLMGGYSERAKPRLAENLDRVFTLFPRLAERRSQLAGSMSGGEQQMLAIARGLMSDPRLIILDEPSLGLMPTMVDHLFGLIMKIRATGISLILVEQNVHQALEIADHAYVVEKGRTTLAGTGRDLLANDAVRRSFLGM